MGGFNYEKEPKRDILFIDVKSFYASVECVSLGMDPMTTMLVVMSHSDNTGNGLVLAASPMAKKVLGITNVTRNDNMPVHPDLIKVPPRMSFYIKENTKVNNVIRKYVAEEDLMLYSIDESMMDITRSMDLFFPDTTFSRTKKRWEFAKMIQQDIYQTTKLYVTVGIGDNPLLAKLALDNESKHNQHLISEWTYQDVPNKVWRISPMTDFWGIGHRTQKRLHLMGIESIEQLAQASPDFLRSRMGIIGEQLYHHANGIDRTILSDPTPQVLEKSYGNSQVLNRNYYLQEEIEIVIKEMAEQVAARIRRHHCQTACIHVSIGVAFGETASGFSRQMKIPPTDNSRKLVAHCLFLFRKYYTGQVTRHVGITYSKLLYTENIQLDLFENAEEQLQQHKLDLIIDKIREKYGFTAIVHANSHLEGARAIARSKLVGGHAGGMDGISNVGPEKKIL
ncbi:Y-family DNA polymerase [Enterococcus sp. DIV0876]|uniref:Y-family DNA polymerase n=1 Tax=Enterococcus sp. DIV0876 TaxID=2774633 RepID=UPI003D2FE8C7